MKALKHSIEWVKFSKPQKDAEGRELPINPYSRLTSLQICVVGYDINGKFTKAYYGNGSETLYINLGITNYSKENIKGRAKLLHDSMILGPKMSDEILIQ